MRSGDLSLRPAGLEAKQGAQRAVGDRGQASPHEATEPADGTQVVGQVGEKAPQGQTTGVDGTEQGQMHTQAEEGNEEKRAMVGHLKAD